MSLLTQFYNSSGGGGGSVPSVVGFNPSAVRGQLIGIPPSGSSASVTLTGYSTTGLTLNNGINIYYAYPSTPFTNPYGGFSGTGVSTTFETNCTKLYGTNWSLSISSGYFAFLANTTRLELIDGVSISATGFFRWDNLPITFTTWSNSLFVSYYDVSGGQVRLAGANLANVETCQFRWLGTNPAQIELGNKLTVASVTKVIDDAYDQLINGAAGNKGAILLARGTNAGLGSLSAATQAKVTALTTAGWTVNLNP